MNDKFFLDTNIFAYMFDARASQKAEYARRLIKQAVSTRKGVVSQQVVQEFFNLAFRNVAKRFSGVEKIVYFAGT